jgi:hypothetical protein
MKTTLRNQSGQLAVVMILSVAALTSGLMIWRHMEAARSQYRRLRSSNELKTVAQMVFASAKADLMRQKDSPLLPPLSSGVKISDFRKLQSSGEINYAITAQAPSNCASHTAYSSADYNSSTDWIKNILCTNSGTAAVALGSTGKISVQISTRGPSIPQDSVTGAFARPIKISVVVDTKTGPGIYPFREEITKNFNLTLALGNQFGVALADRNAGNKRIRVKGLGQVADYREILAGNAPGVIFDSKVLVILSSIKEVPVPLKSFNVYS